MLPHLEINLYSTASYSIYIWVLRGIQYASKMYTIYIWDVYNMHLRCIQYTIYISDVYNIHLRFIQYTFKMYAIYIWDVYNIQLRGLPITMYIWDLAVNLDKHGLLISTTVKLRLISRCNDYVHSIWYEIKSETQLLYNNQLTMVGCFRRR